MSVQMAVRFDFFFSKVKFGTPQVGSPVPQMCSKKKNSGKNLGIP